MKKEYDLNGQKIPGEEVEFETERENWNTYILHDGTRLKMKSVLSQVVRLDAHRPDGEPIYIVQAQNIVATDAPDNLKRKG